jgi:bidirectional [NiFe] hydrogenase diaphorase subunit
MVAVAQSRKSHTCVVCIGEACCRKGSGAVLEALQGRHETDERFRIVTAECVGCCGSAPAALFDRKLATRLDRSAALERIEAWAEEAA